MSTVSGARADEWLYFYPVTGELSLGVYGRWKDFDSGESSQKIEYEESLRLNLNGYSLDPRIFTFNVRLEPTFKQAKTESTTSDFRTDTTYLNYGARFSLLHGVPASPVSLGANFSANTGETDGSLGNRSDFTTEVRGANLRWKFAPFPTTLSYSERSYDETFFSGFGQPPTQRDEFQRTLTLQGRSSKMGLLLEGIEFDDRTYLDNDYDSERARLDNNFHWGKNSSLTSRLEYFNREGFSAEEKATVAESVRLQHTRNLSTTYEYGYESLLRTTDTETHRAGFSLNHRLYQNLDTTLRLSGSTQTSSDGFQDDTYSANLDFNYNKQFRPDLRLSANIGGGYSSSDRTGGQLDFTESPTVPGSGLVVLTQRYIIWSTIVVTAPGCNPCLEPSDYIVEDAGGDFTQLRIPVGSRINIGDTITVDYAYQPPSAEYYGIPYRVGFRLKYGPFAVYHRTYGENQTFVSGPDPNAVGDRRTDTTGLEWSWVQTRTQASVGGERVYTETIGRTSTEYLLNQSLNYTIAPNATLRAKLRQSFLSDTTDIDTYSGDLSLRWLPTPRLSVTPRLSAFRRNADPGGTDSFAEAGVDVLWKWNRLAFDMRYDHTLREDNGANTVEDRVFMTVTRKF